MLSEEKVTRRLQLAAKRTCAWVGWTGSNADSRRLEQLTAWLSRERPAELRAMLRRGVVKFDLAYVGNGAKEYGGDFLVDERHFEVVILHYLFAGWEDHEFAPRPAIGETSYFACSPHHSPRRWRRRLRATGARMIVAFGGLCEVAGSYLAPLRGYRKVDTPFGAIFERVDSLKRASAIDDRRSAPRACSAPRLFRKTRPDG